MTSINRTPQNTNYLQPTKFMLSFSRIPTVTYFCQSVNIPGVSVGQAPINLPSLMVYAPGNQLAYNNLNIDFNLDEEMQSWQEIYKWFLSFASPEGTDERNYQTSIQQNQTFQKNPQKEYYSDATLTVLNALNNPVVRVQFYNVFPVSISDVTFDTKQSADDIMIGNANFVYERYKFLPLN
jgi:hypothetical protein